MRKLALPAVAAVVVAACNPFIASDPPGTYVHPVFNVAQNPPEVPSPNDLFR